MLPLHYGGSLGAEPVRDNQSAMPRPSAMSGRYPAASVDICGPAPSARGIMTG
ncbi:hypothetical protein ACFSEO_19725 [Agromyces cerinus subsp. nitratus]|uniref:hypothetical protein n=1 Tax=Agromyces cerinus TaxID=33878 RepID=UPI00363906E8